VNPKHLKLLKQAQVLDLAGKAAEASVAYRAFLDWEPKYADAWADYAGQLLKLDQPEEAQKACDAALAINPHQLAARINLGVILMRQDRLKEAEGQFRSALEVDPGRMDAQLFLAECLLNQRDLVSAQKVLDKSNQPGAMTGRYAVLQPHHAALWAIFGLALSEKRKFREAEKACHISLQIDSRNLQARSNLGSIWMAQGHLERAEELYRGLVADQPLDETHRLLLITCLSRKVDTAPVCQEINKVIELHPSNFFVHKSVVATYYDCGLWPEFNAEIERYREVDPTCAFLDFEQSLMDLMFGSMPQGWERYEARLKVPGELRLKEHIFAQPAWQGEAFPGRTLLLWAEQGLGDALMFIRYLPLVKALGGRVILETWPALMGVAATCAGVDIIIPKGAPLPPFDLQASLLSLPWIFRTDLSSIPAEVPYLDVPDDVPHRQALLEQLAQAFDSTRIGLVWAGSPGHVRDFERSVPVASLAPLAALSGVTWFSLQVGDQEIPPLPNLIELAPFLKNFSDTAYALSGMDLLITVDTAVAHLAGALGIPTLLLLSFQPDFRWLLNREDSPWYPSLCLYRQPAYGDWGSVIRQVLQDLTQGS
jgi:tetratricopeptide (TPR) repeat protein